MDFLEIRGQFFRICHLFPPLNLLFMRDHYTEIDTLLAKKLAGEASPGEEKTIATWLETSPENVAYYHAMQLMWDKLGQVPITETDTLRTEEALAKVKSQIRASKPRAKVVAMRFWVPAIAASLALLFAAIWFFGNPKPEQPQVLMAKNDTLTDTLTDGSIITLNRNSGLMVQANFNGRERRARLSGEAYFKVAPDASRPFVVEVGELEVQVVGTAFNVDAASTPGMVKVAVLEGKVRLQSGKNTLFLSLGEAAVFDQKTLEISPQTSPDPNVLAYQNRQFLFDETPLKTVIQQLNTVYGANIRLKNPALENCLLSARYDNLPLTRVLNLITETFSIRMEQNGGEILLDGSSCGE